MIGINGNAPHMGALLREWSNIVIFSLQKGADLNAKMSLEISDSLGKLR